MSEAGSRKQEVGSSEDEFELALTRAMRRVEVRTETSAKFLAIAAEAAAERKRTGKLVYRPRPNSLRGGLLVMLPRPKIWLSGAIAAALVAGVFVAQDVHQRHEREVANRQFALSMQIEERAMEHTRQQLQKAGVPLE
jgi:hypothetical protein